jgi:NitT/TauT family transport system substrate-binding protein
MNPTSLPLSTLHHTLKPTFNTTLGTTLRATLMSGIAASLLCIAPNIAKAQDVIRLGNLKFAHYGAVAYIKELAPKCGIKVDEKIFAKGLDVMQAVIAGELDVAAVSSEAAIMARAQNTPVFIVAGFAKGGARLVVRPDLGIKGVKDLKGKKVGVTRGGIHEVLLIAELAKHGLSYATSPGKDVHLLYLGFPELNQALLGKDVDAIMQSEPQSSQAINKGFGTELLKPYDTPIGEPVRTLAMTEKFYQEQRPLAEKFMRCFVESTKGFIENPALAEKYVTQTIFKGQITRDDFQDAISNSPYSYDISAEHIQITTDTMAKYGVGKMSKPPVAKDWVKTDLLDQAKKSLGVK